MWTKARSYMAGECKLVQLPRRTTLPDLSKSQIYVRCGLATLLPEINFQKYLPKIYSHVGNDTYTELFMTAVLVIVKDWKQLKCLSFKKSNYVNK